MLYCNTEQTAVWLARGEWQNLRNSGWLQKRVFDTRPRVHLICNDPKMISLKKRREVVCCLYWPKEGVRFYETWNSVENTMQDRSVFHVCERYQGYIPKSPFFRQNEQFTLQICLSVHRDWDKGVFWALSSFLSSQMSWQQKCRRTVNMVSSSYLDIELFILLFADDLALLTTSPTGPQTQLDCLQRVSRLRSHC